MRSIFRMPSDNVAGGASDACRYQYIRRSMYEDNRIIKGREH